MLERTGGLSPSSATDLRLLVDGAATYDALLEAINSATDHVHAEYYIFAADESGRAIRDALTAAARRGVKVRLLLDALGSGLDMRFGFFRELSAAGGEVEWFHRLRLWREHQDVDGLLVTFLVGADQSEAILRCRLHGGEADLAGRIRHHLRFAHGAALLQSQRAPLSSRVALRPKQQGSSTALAQVGTERPGRNLGHQPRAEARHTIGVVRFLGFGCGGMPRRLCVLLPRTTTRGQ